MVHADVQVGLPAKGGAPRPSAIAECLQVECHLRGVSIGRKAFSIGNVVEIGQLNYQVVTLAPRVCSLMVAKSCDPTRRRGVTCPLHRGRNANQNRVLARSGSLIDATDFVYTFESS